HRAPVVLDVADHLLIRGDEAAGGGEGLRERPDDDVHLVLEPEMRRGAAALLAEHPHPVGIVQDQPGAVLLLQRHDPGQVGQVASMLNTPSTTISSPFLPWFSARICSSCSRSWCLNFATSA